MHKPEDAPYNSFGSSSGLYQDVNIGVLKAEGKRGLTETNFTPTHTQCMYTAKSTWPRNHLKPRKGGGGVGSG